MQLVYCQRGVAKKMLRTTGPNSFNFCLEETFILGGVLQQSII